jgi:hypothetical protein
LSANPPHIGIDKENMKLALHLSTCYMARYTTNFDCGFETPWYYVICDAPIDLKKLNSANRYNINHGLRHFYVQKIRKNLENVRELYRIYKKSSERYTNFTPVSESDFIEAAINSFESNVYYGAYYKNNNLLCGYTSVKEQANVASFNTMKLDQAYFKFGLTYVLVFWVTDIYLKQKKFKYIHNGERSVRHDTEMQDFLIKRLSFRKAYTNLHMEYKFFLGLLIRICYPFRKLFNKLHGILFHNVSALLLQEQIAQETNRFFTQPIYKFYHLDQNYTVNIELQSEYDLQVLQPHNSVHNILWTIFSMGRFKEYRILYNSKVIAYAQTMPKIFIFSFMHKKGLHIGPYWTHHDFRGQGLYPYLLRKIIDDNKNKTDHFYIFADYNNSSSHRGIVKAGGEMFALGYKSKLGVYKILNTNTGNV